MAGGFCVAWRRRARELAAVTAAHEQLLDQARRAEAQLAENAGAMRTQNDLLAVVCREVRGHLDGIIGSADLVLETQLQSAQRTQLVTLKTTGESLLYLLNDLQTLSQAEFRMTSGERQDLILRAEMAQVIEVLAPRAMLKGVELVLLVEPDVPRQFKGDDVLFRQFVFNLLASALRAAPPGPLVFTVARSAAAAKPIASGQVWLRFSATAPRAAADAESANSASPFAVLDHLPLTIARRLTQLLGGEHGEASADSGLAMWFDLPLEQADSPEVAPNAADSLVVWDNVPAARIALANLLAEMRIGCELAHGTPEVLDALQSALHEHDGDVFLVLDESIEAAAATALADAFGRLPVLQAVKIILLSCRPEKAKLPPGLPVRAILPKPVLQPRDVQQAMDSARVNPALAPVTEHAFSQPPYPIGIGSGPQVLLVEDDEVSCQVNATVLKRLGCRVEVAGDGLTAVTLAKRRSYDLIFMDCHLPQLNGFRAAERIRAQIGSKAPPVIALTAESASDIRVRAAECGMADFLLKPATRGEFERMLEKWCPRAGAEQARDMS